MANHLLMCCGFPSSGKSTALMNLKNPEGVFYLGTEANKPLPFPDKFKKLKTGLNHPNVVFQLFDQIEQMPEIHTVVIDSINFLMDLFETTVIVNAKDSRAEWGNYQQFFKRIMQHYVAKSTKNWIFTAHVNAELQNNGNYRYSVPVKGALKAQGLEAYFSIIVYARNMTINELENYQFDDNLFTLTERDKRNKTKRVFQCDITPDMVESGIRAPLGCFADNQIFMDNDFDKLLSHLDSYYGKEKPYYETQAVSA